MILSMQNVMLIVDCTYEHEYAVKMTLKKFMEQVKQAHCFIQIHRSYAINMKYIYRIDKNHINMVDEESKNRLNW